MQRYVAQFAAHPFVAVIPSVAILGHGKADTAPGHVATFYQYGQVTAERGIGQVQVEVQSLGILAQPQRASTRTA